MHKYKKYPKYKESGVAWLGEIPEHWEQKRLKAILQERNEKNNPVKTKNILSLCMYRGVIPYSEKGNSGNKAKDDLTAYKLAYPNDIVLNSMNVVAGSVGLSKYFGAVSPVYYMLNPRDINDNIKYYNAIFQSESFQKSLIGLGNGILVKQSEKTGKLNTIRMKISMDSLNNVLMPKPPYQEQQTIANYLDKATAKIDTLIQKQEQLIELLKEKRQALISHTVTKGLNPDVKMKDSGIEWLGEIPEHWNLSKLRFDFSFAKGLTITKANLKEEGIPCVNYGEIHSKYGFEVSAERDKLKCVDEEYLNSSKISLLSKGDFVFADTSEDIDGAGNFTHLIGESQVFAGYHTVIARQNNDEQSSRFFAYLFDSIAFRTQIRLAVKGVKVFSITQFILKNSTLWFPDSSEQKYIAQYLDDKTSKIDTLINKATKAIELLKERRTALISAVVTGKIDVRFNK